MRNTKLLSIAGLMAVTVSAGGATAQAVPAASGQGVPAASDTATKTKAEKIAERIEKKLPKDWKARKAAMDKKLGIEREPAQEAALAKVAKAAKAKKSGQTRAINPDDYQCSETKLDAYVDSILKDVDPITVLLLSLNGGLDLATYDALLFGTPNDGDHDLLPAYNTNLRNTFSITQRFWDVKLNDVKLLGMNGSVYQDEDRAARVVQALYGVGPAAATDIARDIIELIDSDPGLDGGENPIFTLNAFAFSAKGETDPLVKGVPDKIVFGDGILKALKAIGLNNVGPKAVLSHEMAHHVQYENNTFDDAPSGPEGTRYTELGADAFATYSAAHKKGLGLNPSQLLKFQDSFYDVGDCSFTSSGHHGTPNQRRAASAWGAATVAYSSDPVKIIKSKNLQNKFNKVLPQLVAPDAPVLPEAYKSSVVAAK
ncbi:hypothetical protein ACMYYO_07830 [Dermacoccaceae bacterium W4C1]